MTPRELDEDDVRIRPGRSSRPRTRIRPTHQDAVAGVVVAVDRGRYTCRLDGELAGAVRAGNLRRTAVVVGDEVRLAGRRSASGDLLRIVAVAERRTVLRRTPDDDDPIERPVVANADLLVVVTSLADPEPNLRLVDRCLVAAFDGGLDVLLCLTKADLSSPTRLLERYGALAVPAVALSRGEPLPVLLERLHARTSVLFGPSGVGKSTLVNQLIPGSNRLTADVGAGGRGRHTSSSAVLLALPGGGDVVDTPGVRSFGLGMVDAARVLAAFPDLSGFAAACPRGCDHVTSVGCALDRAPVEPARLDSVRRLLRARAEPQ